MRRAPLLVLLALLVAGCAASAPDPAPPSVSLSPTPAATPAAPTPAAPSPSSTPAAEPRLGVLFERTFRYEGNTNETRVRFDVDPGVDKLTFFVDSAGPPEDRSFTSAVMDVYAPGFTSPMFAELPGQQKHNYTRELTAGHPYWGSWMVRFDGTGKTSVTLRVTAE